MTTVLVVGDRSHIDEALVRAFEREGIEVERIADAMSAIAYLDRTQADVVVSATELPQWGGLRLLRHVDSSEAEPLTFLVVEPGSGTLTRAQQADVTPLVTDGENWGDLADIVTDRLFESQVSAHRDRRYHLAVATATVLLEALDSLKRASTYRKSTDLLRETAIVSTREVVEESVCRQLSDVPGYGLVWVSHYYPDEGDLVPQAASGMDVEQLQAQQASEYTAAGVDLAEGEVETRRGDTHTELIIPLQNDDHVHGAIHVQQSREAVSSFERDQLGNLGRIVSRFISALEKLQDLAETLQAAEGDPAAEASTEESGDSPTDRTDGGDAAVVSDADSPPIEAIDDPERAGRAAEPLGIEDEGDSQTEADEPAEAVPDAETDESAKAVSAVETEESTESAPSDERDQSETSEPRNEAGVSVDPGGATEEEMEGQEEAGASPAEDEAGANSQDYDGPARSEAASNADAMSPLVAYSDTVAHELRNHVNVAEAFLDLGRTKGDEENFERVEAALDRIERLTDEAAAVAGDSIDPAQMDQGELADAATIAWDRVEAPDAELTLEETASVKADHDLLELLLENLFRNAADHVGPDVHLWVGLLEHVDGFYVEDDGPGIPEADRDRLFGWGESGGDSDGGIGLAIVERIAENHGWSISIADGREGGARFEIAGVEVVE